MRNAYDDMGTFGMMAAAGVANVMASGPDRRRARLAEQANDALQDEVAALRHEIAELQDRLDTSSNAHWSAVTDLMGARVQIAELGREADSLRAELASAEEHLRLAGGAIGSLSSDFEQLSSTQSYQERRIKELERSLEAAVDTVNARSASRMALIGLANDLVMQMHELMARDQLWWVDWTGHVRNFRRRKAEFLAGVVPSREDSVLLLAHPMPDGLVDRARALALARSERGSFLPPDDDEIAAYAKACAEGAAPEPVRPEALLGDSLSGIRSEVCALRSVNADLKAEHHKLATKLRRLEESGKSLSAARDRESADKIALVDLANRLYFELHACATPEQLQSIDFSEMLERCHALASAFLQGKTLRPAISKLAVQPVADPATLLEARHLAEARQRRTPESEQPPPSSGPPGADIPPAGA